MQLDMRDWMERYAAIMGRYYEGETIALLQRLLKPNMLFIDIGGNLGFVSLTASSLVGPGGQIYYIEPNPVLVKRFRETLEVNKISNVDVFEVALAKASGEVGLQMGESHGLTRVVEGSGISAVTGDELLGSLPTDVPMLVKLDVEGYEEQVLSGMNRTIARADTAFFIEVTDSWLRRHGGSADSLFATMRSAGYSAWLSQDRPLGSLLVPMSSAHHSSQCNILFARTGQFGAV